jgi:hypothetical protein
VLFEFWESVGDYEKWMGMVGQGGKVGELIVGPVRVEIFEIIVCAVDVIPLESREGGEVIFYPALVPRIWLKCTLMC